GARNKLRAGVAALSLVEHVRPPRAGPLPRPQDYACSAQMQCCNRLFIGFAASLRSLAKLLASRRDIDVPARQSLAIVNKHRVELRDATKPPNRPRRLLALPRGRWLVDRKPHRALGADGDVSLLHRAHLARRLLLRLERSCRRGGEADAGDVAR